jgi:DNA-binding transcriptional ArsR family regulator
MDDQLLQELEMLYNQVCHALGDPKRLMMLYTLAGGPKCVGDIAAELAMPQPTVSRHLKILRERALVETTRDGTTVYYALTDERLIQALDLLRGILRDRLLKQARVVESQMAGAL